MLILSKTLSAWNSGQFNSTLKQELEALPPGSLPLHLATQRGGQADDSDIAVLVNNIYEHIEQIDIQIGVFFYEIVGGCSCGDEPPSENTYCEMQLSINKKTAETIASVHPFIPSPKGRRN